MLKKKIVKYNDIHQVSALSLNFMLKKKKHFQFLDFI